MASDPANTGLCFLFMEFDPSNTLGNNWFFPSKHCTFWHLQFFQGFVSSSEKGAFIFFMEQSFLSPDITFVWCFSFSYQLIHSTSIKELLAEGT